MFFVKRSVAPTLTAWMLLALCFAGTAGAQTTGKISGRITDATTGEGLIGATVRLDGTTQGAATDVNGEYVIIGVRPGAYTVVATYIGYASELREGVEINVDLTTTVDFQLREETFQGEEVVVTADALAIRKDVTSSEARVTAENIDRLPVQELGQILGVQAGVTTQGGGLHIRGGRSSEVLYMVDGVPVTDAFNGSLAVQVENDGIQELQVISGTFNAEYGNAMSGVINVVTKEGRNDRIGGSVELYSGSYLTSGEGGEAFLRGTDRDDFTSRDIEYREVDPYSYLPVNPAHYYNAAVSLEGPVFSDRLTFFGLGRVFKNDGWLYGSRLYNADGTAGDSALVPMNSYEKYSWQGNLRYQLSKSIIVNLISLGSLSDSRDYDLFRRWSPDGRPNNYDIGYDAKLKVTHLVSPKTFYTLDAATFYREFERYLYENPLDPRYNNFNGNTPDSVEIRPGEWEQVITGGGRFARGGTDLGRMNRFTRSYFAKGDITSQVHKYHLVKMGVSAKVDQLSFEQFSLIAQENEAGNPIEPFVPALPDPDDLRYRQFDNVAPLTVSAYLQDKLEFESFIVNAGLRFDYFDARARVPADPSDPYINDPLKPLNRFNDPDGDGVISAEEETEANRKSVAQREAYWYRNTSSKWALSPRLGIAYPITAEGVIHFSYGHFLQIPTLDRLFDNYGYKLASSSTGNFGPFGNPDLDLQRTTMYEIGFKQGFGPLVLDVTGYYRDVRQWVSTSPLILTAKPSLNYVIYANRDYANTRGVTATVSKQFANSYAFDLSYTYQVVEGSNSDPSEEFFNQQSGASPTISLLPLSWDQRHKLAGSFFVTRGGWSAAFLGVLASGFPYTPAFSEAEQVGSDVPPINPSNSRRQPSTIQLDANFSREFTFGTLRPRLFLQIYNLLDRRNPVAVFSDTGRPDVTLGQLQGGAFDPGYYVRPDFYAEPRRIHVGVDFRF